MKTHRPIKTTSFQGFTVDEYFFGFQSYRDNTEEPLILSHSLKDCSYWTEQFLKAEQDGEWSTEAKIVNDGVVGGKL